MMQDNPAEQIPCDWQQTVERDEHRFAGLIDQYLAPLLTPTDRILSIGCGTGTDVRLLRAAGYQCQGVEPGPSTALWAEYPPDLRAALSASTCEEQPFGAQAFDVAYAFEVIEHVGCVGPGLTKVLEDTWQARVAFMEAALDTLAPGGRLYLFTSNRLCPFDMGHGHVYAAVTDWMRRRGVHLGLPWHAQNFLVSLGDVRRLIAAGRYAGKADVAGLPVARYATIMRRPTALGRAINGYARCLDLLGLGASPLSPLLNVAVTLRPG